MKIGLGPRALLYPTPVVVVGSYDATGKANAMTAAWAGIVCSQPPCVSVSIRRARHSHAAILERQAFSVNLASQDQVRQVDYLGIVSGADVDKFAGAGLTVAPASTVDAPVVAEFPVALECRLLSATDLGVHTLFVGEVVQVWADEEVLGPNGLPDITLLHPLIYAPGQSAYFGVGPRVAAAFSAGREIGGA